MDTLIIIGVVTQFVVIGILLYLLYQKKPSNNTANEINIMSKWMEQVQVRLDRNADVLERGLRMNHDTVANRMDKTSEMLGKVSERIGEVGEIGRSMKELGDFFKSPKMRGNIGEYVLRDLLSQYLPPSNFSMQYIFKTGSIADAVIKTDAGLLCIDSKFPLENYRKIHSSQSDKEREQYTKEFVRDVKKHIDAISSKYILPDEDCLDYAIMYIPSESVYYEIICLQNELLTYSQQKQVLMVSPSGFYAYMRVILLSLEGKKVEETARALLQNFKGLQIEFKRFSEQYGLALKHLHNADNAFDEATRLRGSIDSKMDRMLAIEYKEKELILLDP